MSVAWAHREGAVVDGQFHLGNFLGGTDRSAVFQTQSGGHDAAIKLVPADSQDAELQIARWKLAVNLSHPHLIRLFRTGRCQLGGTPMLYAVMELADENVAEILPQRPLTEDELREMLGPVLDALSYLHRQGFAHGRLKPANIMAVGDKLKLSSDALLPLGEVMHRRDKPDGYDPPEMGTRGNTPVGDIWSLGMTVAEMLTQRLPAREMKTQDDPALPNGLPSPFREIARRCLRLNPEARCTIGDIRSLLTSPPVAEPESVVAAVAPATEAPVPASESLERGAAASKKSPNQLSYIVSAIIAVLIIGAIYITPHFFGNRQAMHAPQTATPPAPITSQSNAQPASSTDKPPVPSAAASRLAPVPAATEKAPSAPARKPTSATRPAAPPLEPRARAPAQASADPQILNQVMPGVSQAARDTISGKVRVIVRVSVDAAGAVKNATLNSSASSRYFADRAIQAARQWKFAPAIAGGQNVASEWTVQFDFYRNDTKVLSTRVAP
jgi:eukaryotic-like serine/threonine-protein kinase